MLSLDHWVIGSSRMSSYPTASYLFSKMVDYQARIVIYNDDDLSRSQFWLWQNKKDAFELEPVAVFKAWIGTRVRQRSQPLAPGIGYSRKISRIYVPDLTLTDSRGAQNNYKLYLNVLE